MATDIGANGASGTANTRDVKINATSSNEKLERRYKEILKENDGKLFEVH